MIIPEVFDHSSHFFEACLLPRGRSCDCAPWQVAAGCGKCQSVKVSCGPPGCNSIWARSYISCRFTWIWLPGTVTDGRIQSRQFDLFCLVSEVWGLHGACLACAPSFGNAVFLCICWVSRFSPISVVVLQQVSQFAEAASFPRFSKVSLANFRFYWGFQRRSGQKMIVFQVSAFPKFEPEPCAG